MGTAFGLTDVGLVRKSNEDNFLIDSALGLVLVSDGMGGHAAGEVASKEALLSMLEFISKIELPRQSGDPNATIQSTTPYNPLLDEDATVSDGSLQILMGLFDAVEFTNSRLYTQNLAKNERDGGGMGTTLTGFWQPRKTGPLVLVHVGDSRLYQYRNAELTQLTHDQTLYQQALDEGKFENLPSRNQLTQAIGPNHSVKPEITAHRANANDIYLLCSDGLHGSAPHGLITDILSKTRQNNLDQACAALVALAKEYGSRDNITVVLIAY